MAPDLKQKLHQLVDNCNDEFLLEEARAVLESEGTGKEFWDELDEEDQENFLGTEEEHDNHSLTHHRLIHQVGEWKKNH